MLNGDEELALNEIPTSLKPMVLLIKIFCKSDFKYEKFGKLIEFVLEKLREAGTNLDKKLHRSLKYRADQRKIKIVSMAVNFFEF